MANRPKGYGMTAELQEKKAAKYDSHQAQQAIEWIRAILGPESVPGPGDYTAEEVHSLLKDGVVLCKLMNTIIQPSNPIKFNTSKMAFKQMENVGKFLDKCCDLGIAKLDLFQTVDLYEAENIPQVINGLHALGRKVQTIRSDLPGLGPKEATEQKREFSQEQLEAGKGIIGLQMGSNQGASQAGMTPAGLQRQIEKTNLKT